MGECNIPQSFHCTLCDVHCSGVQNYKQHMEGIKHLKKQRKDTNFSAAPYGTAPPDVPFLQPQTNTKCHFCEACKVSLSGPASYTDHMRGKQHNKKIHQLQLFKNLMTNQSSTTSQIPQVCVTDKIQSIPSTSAKESRSEMLDSDPKSKSIPSLSVAERKGSGDATNQQPKRMGNEFLEARGDEKFWCKLCNVEIPGWKGIQTHMLGRNHLKKLQQRGIVVDNAQPSTSTGQPNNGKSLRINKVDQECQAQIQTGATIDEPAITEALNKLLIISSEENATLVLRKYYSVRKDDVPTNENDDRFKILSKECKKVFEELLSEKPLIEQLKDDDEMEVGVHTKLNEKRRPANEEDALLDFRKKLEEMERQVIKLKQAQVEMNLKTTVKRLLEDVDEMKMQLHKKRKVEEREDEEKNDKKEEDSNDEDNDRSSEIEIDRGEDYDFAYDDDSDDVVSNYGSEKSSEDYVMDETDGEHQHMDLDYDYSPDDSDSDFF